jgi:chitodextrinase
MKGKMLKASRVVTLTAMLFVLEIVPLLHYGIASAATSVSINTAQHYQNVNGLGVNANVHSWKNGELKPTIDDISNLGHITWRVIIDRSDWEQVNDDSDPFHSNWDVGANSYNNVYSQGKMADLWNTIAYINTKPGQQVTINCMGGDPAWMSGVSGTAGTKVVSGMEDEWVEEISSMIYYGKVVKGLNFNLVSPTNEEDFTNGIEGTYFPPAQYADVMHRLSVRLDSLGLSDMKLIGPDTATSTDARDIYYPAIKNDPVVMNKMAHISLHAYTASLAGTADIVKAAFPDKDLWVTEFSAPCAGCDDGAPNPNNWANASGSFDQLLSDLDQGASGAQIYDAWDGSYEHHGPATNATGQMGYWGLIAYSGNQTTPGVYTKRKSYYTMQQAMKYVPPTAIMVGASSSGSITLRAFTDAASGRLTIIGENTGSTTQTLAGNINAAAGFAGNSLSYTRTNASVNMGDEALAPVPVSASNTFSVDVPANTVFTLTGTTAPADTTPPSAPVLDTPQAISSNRVDLNWSAATDQSGLAGYRVFRSSDSGTTYSQVGTGTQIATTYSDTSAQPNTTYSYKVRAYDTPGNTTDSNAQSVTTPPDTTPPSSPTNLKATAQDTTHVNLTWQSGSSDTVSYTVTRSDLSVPLVSNISATSYTDATAQPNTTYGYSVTAADAAGNVSAPTSVSVSTPVTTSIAVNAQATTTQSTKATSISGTITTTQPSLLVAYLTSDGPSTAQSFNTPTTSGLTWTLRKRANTQVGTAEIWTAPAANPLSNATVTATRVNNGSYRGALTVTAFSGADMTNIGATAGASAATGVSSVNLTPTALGSVVWGVGYSKATASARTVGAGQTKVQEYLGGTTGTSWVQRLNDPTALPGATVIVNDTAPTNQPWNMVAIEILPAVPVVVDNDAPTVSIDTPLDGSTITGTNPVSLTAADGVGVTKTELYVDGLLTATDTTAPYNFDWDTRTVSNGSHVLIAKAYDAAGNVGTSTNVVVTTSNDLEPPTTPTLTATVSSPTQADLSWTASTDNTGVTRYDVYRNGAQIGTVSAETLTYSDTALTAGTGYAYKVVARDAAGNTAVSATQNVTTPTPPDTEAPSVPNGLSVAAVTTTGATLHWNAASDNVATTGYQVVRDGTVIATVTGTSYADTNLSATTSYSYQVVAYDAAGNYSAASAPLGVTTATPDTTGPTVSLSNPGSTVSGTVNLTATASDPSGVAGVQFYVDGTVAGSQDTSAPYQYSWNTAAVANGTHTLTAIAYDSVGNSTTTTPVSVMVNNVASTLAVDKQISVHPTSTSTTMNATGMTTTKTDDLLVAFVSSDGPATASATSFSSVSGGGLTWTLRKRANTQYGTSEIWTAAAPSLLNNATITATRASGSYLGSLVVVAFSGADTSTIGAVTGGSATTGAPSVSLTTTRAGSQVWGVGNDWDNATARTVGTGQTLVDQYLLSLGDTLWVQRTTNPVAAAGTNVTINDTAPTNHRWNLAAIEILPKS